MIKMGITDYRGGVSKTQNGRFTSKIAFRLNSLLQSFLCENCQRQSCKAFIGLTNHAKTNGGGRHILPEILDQSDRFGAKSQIFDLFACSDSAVTPSEKLQLTLIGSTLRAFQ